MNRIKRQKVAALVGLRKEVPIGIGHNQGPPLSIVYHRTHWKKASAAAWKTPDPLILRRRIKRAKELGMTYREYVLEILERGRHL